MATRYYLSNIAPQYTPATLRGAWDQTASAVTRALLVWKQPSGGVTTTLGIAETNAAANWDVHLARFIGPPLAAQTLSGTVDCAIPVIESSTSADLAWHVHIYVTQGDSDTPRGTLLTDYVETTANEWSTSSGAKALASAQTISSLAVSAGDRIVVELGYVALNASASSFTGTIRYGVETAATIPMTADLTAGDTNTTTRAPWIEFSSTFTHTTSIRTTQVPVEVAVDTDPSIRATQAAVEVALDLPPSVRVSQAAIEVASSQATIIRVTQAAVEVAVEDPSYFGIRITQVGIEAAVEDASMVATDGEVTQLVVEVAGGQGAGTRISQLATEVAGAQSADLRVSSLATEIIGGQSADARISQEVIEILNGQPATVRVSQLVIEIIHAYVPPTVVIVDCTVPCPEPSTVGLCDTVQSTVSTECPPESSLDTSCAPSSTVSTDCPTAGSLDTSCPPPSDLEC